MTKPWTRDNTKDWIAQLEHRVEDIDYYLTRTIEWCEDNHVYDDQIVFACCAITVIWVSHMRDEPITQQEMFELLGVHDWETGNTDFYQLGEVFQDLDHEDLLELVASKM